MEDPGASDITEPDITDPTGVERDADPAVDLVPAEATRALTAAMDTPSNALAPATLRVYRAAWCHFCGWCEAAGRTALPASPETVASYLAALAPTHATKTLEQRLAALGHAHKLAGLHSPSALPAIRKMLRGIRRIYGRPVVLAAALETGALTRLVATCNPATLAGCRDRALLLVGYAGDLRRSELVAIAREHLRFDRDGVRLLIPRGKADSADDWVSVDLPRGASPDTCPVRASEGWIGRSACRGGPVFRAIDRWGSITRCGLHRDAVRTILARHAAAAGLVAPSGQRLSPHSLRAGRATQARSDGSRDRQVVSRTCQ